MKSLRHISCIAFVFFVSCSTSDDSEVTLLEDDSDSLLDCTNPSSIFTINLDPTDCDIDIETELGIVSLYSESISGTTRKITINGVANHLVGEFPNSGNPSTIAETKENYTMTMEPELAASVTNGQGYTMAIYFSGVVGEPYTAEYFVGSDGTINRDWNITTLQSERSLGLDCNNAHAQPTGRYHYHGTPSNYVSLEGIDGSEMVKIGYAADGFPIYYKYAYADDGVTLVDLSSGYQLKTIERGGDGIGAPNGCPDGLYFQDYEYVDGISSLDECNGMFGKTPESDNEYFYVVTDNFPSSPLCFSGTPDSSFSFK
ncbi:YHYH protein [Flagellimonas meridianipacifica]|uniref:YHYH protein n=1 Tax=Flagellimonas meridianipacifica TaxID=1080225 RepID=A0A2T0MFQ0_9FLAO|nr:YHYH protein [Allomuricauda pacifica]PRX56399.1 YHYH protein [Allomuricauda pacifica]